MPRAVSWAITASVSNPTTDSVVRSVRQHRRTQRKRKHHPPWRQLHVAREQRQARRRHRCLPPAVRLLHAPEDRGRRPHRAVASGSYCTVTDPQEAPSPAPFGVVIAGLSPVHPSCTLGAKRAPSNPVPSARARLALVRSPRGRRRWWPGGDWLCPPDVQLVTRPVTPTRRHAGRVPHRAAGRQPGLQAHGPCLVRRQRPAARPGR